MKSIMAIDQSIKKITVPTPYLVGPVNIYLVEGERLTLVDVGPKTEEAWEYIKKELKQWGYQPEDIEQIILTHHHPDHIGLLDRFPNTVKLTHPKARPWIELDTPTLNRSKEKFRELYVENGMDEQKIEEILGNQSNPTHVFPSRSKVDIELLEGDNLPGLPGWSVLETPGHAQSHIFLINEEKEIAISGDHLIKHISPNAFVEPSLTEGEERIKPLLQYRDSLKKVERLKLKKVVTGHGEDIGDVYEHVQIRLAEQDKRASVIKGLFNEKCLTADELTRLLFPKMYDKQPNLTFSETLGHIDLLEERGEVGINFVNGKIYYEMK